MNGLSDLYREAIRQHAAEPVGFRRQINATHRHEEYNPLCGDRIEIQLRIVRGEVEAAAFDGEACAICMASASLLCDATPGQPVSYLEALHDRLHAALENGHGLDGAEALKPLLGVMPYPSRIHCATLPWTAAIGAL
jgi:nitrogen fixation NifU-like protein